MIAFFQLVGQTAKVRHEPSSPAQLTLDLSEVFMFPLVFPQIVAPELSPLSKTGSIFLSLAIFRAMFGRVRPSSSPPESLERPHSKILKDDSLSIYEATLMKLKLGSQRDLSAFSEDASEINTDRTSRFSKGSTDALSPSVEAVNMDPNDASASVSKVGQHVIFSYNEGLIDTDFSSASASPSSSDGQSMCSTKQQQSGNLSLLYLFSKYKSSRHALTSSYNEAMTVENGSSAGSTSPDSSEYGSIGNME